VQHLTLIEREESQPEAELLNRPILLQEQEAEVHE